MQECDRFQSQLNDLVDGTLGAGAATELNEHVEGCVTCRGELRALIATRDLLRAHAVPPSDGSRDRVLARFRHDVGAPATSTLSAQRSTLDARRSTLRSFEAAGALIAAVAVALIYVRTGSVQPSTNAPRTAVVPVAGALPSLDDLSHMDALHSARTHALLEGAPPSSKYRPSERPPRPAGTKSLPGSSPSKMRRLNLPVLTMLLLAAVGVATGAPAGRDAGWNIWRKSITVGADVTMRADMKLTQRNHGRVTVSTAHVIQGVGGRYVVTFVGPAEERGKTVWSDGKAYRQFDPRANTLTRLASVTGTGQGARRTDPLIADDYRIELVSDSARVAGRRAYLIEILPLKGALSRQRRWIDFRTYKTLRIETRFADGVVYRVIAYSNVVLPARIPMSAFQPHVPAGIMLVDLTTGPGSSTPHEMPAQAAELRMPVKAAFEFHLMQISSSTISGRENRQLLYCDGIETISVFVQDGEIGARPAPANWQPLSIVGIPMFLERSGHSSVLVWSLNGRRYTAFTRAPADTLQAFVANLVHGSGR